MKKIAVILAILIFGLLYQSSLHANEFKQREAKIATYKKWLDDQGPSGKKYWVRLDGSIRPHRLYLGESFYQADRATQERLIDTYSNYLAGHPEKFMLIDLMDTGSNKWVGEYGFGGFKMYSKTRVVASR